jgi:outer membrane receptor protein involved in Fe transport
LGKKKQTECPDDLFSAWYLPAPLHLAFSKKITEHWSFNLRVSNLLNQPRERYFEGGLPFAVTQTGTTYTMGMSGKW